MITRFIFTCGDINGVGPEITLKVIRKVASSTNTQMIFICPSNAFQKASELTGINPDFTAIKSISQLKKTNAGIVLFDIGRYKITPGKPTLSSGKASYKALETATDIINEGMSETIVTLPISKTSISLAGFGYPGHTEYLAAKSSSKNYTMMFLSDKLKCALATIHEPIKTVPKLISIKLVRDQIKTVCKSLINDFNIHDPRIAVLGLNPHAGEGGKIGNEELLKIIPAIETAGVNVEGPFVPDAFFGKKLYKEFDCVLGMYHDQVLIPFKMLDFKGGVNYTAGLKFVRTSPDHGTAFDIAWTNSANEGSTLKAYKYARQIVNNRRKN